MATWRLQFYEDSNGKRPVESWMEKLDDYKFSAIDQANDLILSKHGKDLVSTHWLKPLGGGLYEFRVRHSVDEIKTMYMAKKKTPPKGHQPILLREFIAFDKGQVIILLGAYDKGKNPSSRTQVKRIAEARKRLKAWKNA